MQDSDALSNVVVQFAAMRAPFLLLRGQRRPQPDGEQRTIAFAFERLGVGSFSRASASGTVNQFPMRVPCRRAPLTRAMPEATSGASIPLSPISAARRRMGVMRRLTVDGAKPGFDQV